MRTIIIKLAKKESFTALRKTRKRQEALDKKEKICYTIYIYVTQDDIRQH